MENLSHTVAGLVAGEIVHRSFPSEPTPEKESTRHRLFLWTTALASNFPDLDLIFTKLLPDPLGYLLHHRGHTHTLFYALPQALLLFTLTWIVWPQARALLKESRPAKLGYAISLAVGFLLHLSMDYLNSYGIHPFHPFDSRWYFGDMIFIVEPFFWIALGVPTCLLVQRRWTKGILLSLLLGAPVLFALRGYLHWASVSALLSVAAFHVFLNRRMIHQEQKRSLTPLLAGVFLALMFVGLQSFSSARAKRRLETKLREMNPATIYLDAAVHSFPTHPFCWNFLTIEKNEKAGTYTLRKGLLSTAPSFVSQASCPEALVRGEPIDLEAREFSFFDSHVGRLDKLRELNRNDCHFQAWLRFVRAPVVLDDRSWDARFSSGSRGNFSTFLFADFEKTDCSENVPQWIPPREDLLKAE